MQLTFEPLSVCTFLRLSKGIPRATYEKVCWKNPNFPSLSDELPLCKPWICTAEGELKHPQ